ncbi:MarR family winged helix-turn-helix transcriptional regulator [Tateyamaria sp. ANG-S1]|uniref:MarR family winged helix-turn-helix transcriptional regulator n=1 Tax=Tateyamaria sp. ANG-S1 TaxID=1577905 RepID=UPI00057F630A|nr:MarR family winged helix-turn-helix transcriptional regulator [Tateyamaria sp. ANG-S1]KIC50026.1 MarR family transcriptional regulator [Tateyamaria sp. ANG-S1]
MYIVTMQNSELYQIVWMSRPLMQAAEAAVEQGLADTDLTVRMRAVLEVLHAEGDMTVPDIAARLDIKRQYVQVMVNETLTSGLTRQCPNPRHKRSPLLALTDTGRALIAQVIEREMALLQTIGADLPSDDISTALRVVRMLTERLREESAGT